MWSEPIAIANGHSRTGLTRLKEGKVTELWRMTIDIDHLHIDNVRHPFVCTVGTRSRWFSEANPSTAAGTPTILVRTTRNELKKKKKGRVNNGYQRHKKAEKLRPVGICVAKSLSQFLPKNLDEIETIMKISGKRERDYSILYSNWLGPLWPFGPIL